MIVEQEFPWGSGGTQESWMDTNSVDRDGSELEEAHQIPLEDRQTDRGWEEFELTAGFHKGQW